MILSFLHIVLRRNEVKSSVHRMLGRPEIKNGFTEARNFFCQLRSRHFCTVISLLSPVVHRMQTNSFYLLYLHRRKEDLCSNLVSYNCSEIFSQFIPLILCISSIILSIWFTMSDDFLTLNKMDTPSHELTYSIDT